MVEPYRGSSQKCAGLLRNEPNAEAPCWCIGSSNGRALEKR